jgi:hypothetical protein
VHLLRLELLSPAKRFIVCSILDIGLAPVILKYLDLFPRLPLIFWDFFAKVEIGQNRDFGHSRT